MSLSIRYRRSGGYQVEAGPGLATAGGRFGTAPLGSPLTLTTGSGTQQANVLYRKDFTIATVTALNIDLKGATGELDVLNVALNLTRVRWLYVELTTPGANTSIEVGPRGVANGWQGPWGGVAATDRTMVSGRFEVDDPFDLWPVVGATTKILSLYNPGAAAVSGVILVAGI